MNEVTTPHPRVVTLLDIAAVAQVHKSTVSLALRNQPCIPVATRERIRAIADSLGYYPDPDLRAFAQFRRAVSRPRMRTLALITDLPTRGAFEKSLRHQELFRGAKEKAEELGFRVELFFVGPSTLSPKRLNHILVSRGIAVVILAGLGRHTTELPLQWENFSAMGVESLQVRPRLDNIVTDYRSGGRVVVEQLRSRGHRRIGVVVDSTLNEELMQFLRAGYLIGLGSSDERIKVPFLRCDVTRTDETASALEAWVKLHAVDAIVASSPAMHDLIRSHLPRWMEAPALFSLDIPPTRTDLAGVCCCRAALAARAVEMLAVHQHANLRGLPAHCATTFIAARWQEGSGSPIVEVKARSR